MAGTPVRRLRRLYPGRPRSAGPNRASRKSSPVSDVQRPRAPPLLPERTNETHSLVDAYFQQEGVSIKAFIEIGNEEAIKQAMAEIKSVFPVDTLWAETARRW